MISGWIDDSSDESGEKAKEPQMPWRNHVDFDELHPGEDQIAEESIPQPNLDPIMSFIQNPVASWIQNPSVHLPLGPFAAPQVPEMPTLPTEENPRRVVLPMPRFNTDPEREFANPFLSRLVIYINLLKCCFFKVIN